MQCDFMIIISLLKWFSKLGQCSLNVKSDESEISVNE